MANKSQSEKDEMLNDAAAIAESIQPKGNTLSSTSTVTPIPFLLKHTLREYQHIGLDWLVTMHDRKLNGILADEMRLGKTAFDHCAVVGDAQLGDGVQEVMSVVQNSHVLWFSEGAQAPAKRMDQGERVSSTERAVHTGLRWSWPSEDMWLMLDSLLVVSTANIILITTHDCMHRAANAAESTP